VKVNTQQFEPVLVSKPKQKAACPTSE